MRFLAIFYFSLMLLIISSCNRPECNNQRETFNISPYNEAYKTELARLIDSAGKDAYRYWIAGYTTKNGSEYLEANIQNDNVCAIMVLDVTDNSQLQQFRNVQGKGYAGASLVGLDYIITRRKGEVSFVLNNVGRIVD